MRGAEEASRANESEEQETLASIRFDTLPDYCISSFCRRAETV